MGRTEERTLHGAIDIAPWNTKVDTPALAMFNVKLVSSGWTPAAGWKLLMEIKDDFEIDGKNCKGKYLAYFHLAKNPKEYFGREVEGIEKSAGEAVGIVGGRYT